MWGVVACEDQHPLVPDGPGEPLPALSVSSGPFTVTVHSIVPEGTSALETAMTFTGVQVQQGDIIHVSTTGEVRGGPVGLGFQFFDANGAPAGAPQSSAGPHSGGEFPIIINSPANIYSLIGSIADPLNGVPNQWFFLGTENAVTAFASGELVLLVHDALYRFDYPLAYRDNAGSFEATITINPMQANAPPAADAGGPYEGSEGETLMFDGSASADPDGDALTLSWTYGDGGTGTGETPSHAYADDGIFEVTLTAIDPQGESDVAAATATILNVAPAVGPVSAPLDPVPVGTLVDVSADFNDPGTNDTHLAMIDWGDGTVTAATVTEGSGAGVASDDHVYAVPGVYTVAVTVEDDDGGVGEGLFQFVVVYDPDGGFVTGGGWIDSPLGAYAYDADLMGRANFGFVSKYRKGASVPSGNTQFQFRAADLTFHSTEYEWLVVSGARGQFKGGGLINDAGDYGFLLTLVDGQRSGGGGTDRFRIKIWDRATGDVVYDNQLGDADSDDPTTTIGGGSIVIHK